MAAPVTKSPRRRHKESLQIAGRKLIRGCQPTGMKAAGDGRISKTLRLIMHSPEARLRFGVRPSRFLSGAPVCWRPAAPSRASILLPSSPSTVCAELRHSPLPKSGRILTACVSPFPSPSWRPGCYAQRLKFRRGLGAPASCRLLQQDAGAPRPRRKQLMVLSIK